MDNQLESRGRRIRSNKNIEKERWDFSIFKAIQSVAGAAIIVATLFTLWTPANLFTGQIFDSMFFVLQEADNEEIEDTPTPAASFQRIGIVAGHWKDNEYKGWVCPDGLTEEQLNLRIATLVMQDLNSRGYEVDLLEEFDARLPQYKSLAVVSIHNGTCEFLGNDATGYKVAPALSNAFPENSEDLAMCMIDKYRDITGLRYQTNKITPDMTTYHTFNEVHSTTPVIIIEAGYMNLDRQMLTEEANKISNGIVEGILCYLLSETHLAEPTVQ